MIVGMVVKAPNFTQTNVVEDILREFRYYAMPRWIFPEKMADTKSKISVNCDIFGNN